MVIPSRVRMVSCLHSEVFAKRILEYFHLDGSRHTKAEVIEYVLRENGIGDLEKVVMLGDRKHDIIGAKAMGIDFIGVLYGYGDREELTVGGADYIVEDIKGLEVFLLK